jgi:hypothetical protein
MPAPDHWPQGNALAKAALAQSHSVMFIHCGLACTVWIRTAAARYQFKEPGQDPPLERTPEIVATRWLEICPPPKRALAPRARPGRGHASCVNPVSARCHKPPDVAAMFLHKCRLRPR